MLLEEIFTDNSISRRRILRPNDKHEYATGKHNPTIQTRSTLTGTHTLNIVLPAHVNATFNNTAMLLDMNAVSTKT